MGRKKGLTGIEWGVVVMIVAIVSVLLLSVYTGVQEKKKAPTCVNNQKEIARAVITYCQDYDEKFPCQASSDVSISSGRGPQNVYDEVFPLLKNNTIWHCPFSSTGPGGPISYVANGNVFIPTGLNIAQIAFPKNLMILTDSGSGNSDDQVHLRPQGPSGTPPKLCTDQFDLPNIHNDGAAGLNITFADGHVQYFTPSEAASTVAQVPTDTGPGCP